MRNVVATAGLALAVGLPWLVGAQESIPVGQVATPRVAAQLVMESTGVTPGGTLNLGVLVNIIPEWHIYWTNPGESGLPTRFVLSSVPGVSLGDIQWPAPHSFHPSEEVINYGYDGQVLFPFTIQVEPVVKVGEVLPVQVEMKWLACREACVPGTTRVSLKVPVVATPGAGLHTSLFESSRAQLPTPPNKTDRLMFQWEPRADHAAVVVEVWGANDIEFFPSATSDYQVSKSTPGRSKEGPTQRLELVGPSPSAPPQGDSPPSLRGVVVWHERGIGSEKLKLKVRDVQVKANSPIPEFTTPSGR